MLADAHLNILELGRWDKARVEKTKEAIDAALRISPNSAEAHLRKARYFQGANDIDAAEKELAIAAAGLPGRVDVYSLRADIERRAARWKEALRDALKAAELDPRDPVTAEGLAEVYIPLRHYAEVERLMDHMIAAAPEKATGFFWRWKCSIALAKGDAKAALAALESSPSRNAGLFGFNHARAYVIVLQRDYTRAEQLLQSIDVTAKPGNAVPDDGNELHRRGLTLERLGRIHGSGAITKRSAVTSKRRGKVSNNGWPISPRMTPGVNRMRWPTSPKSTPRSGARRTQFAEPEAQLRIVRRSTIHGARVQTFKRCLQSLTCGVANAMLLFNSLPQWQSCPRYQ